MYLPNCRAKLSVEQKPKIEVENHMRPERDQKLLPNAKLVSQPEPTETFEVGLPKL